MLKICVETNESIYEQNRPKRWLGLCQSDGSVRKEWGWGGTTTEVSSGPGAATNHTTKKCRVASCKSGELEQWRIQTNTPHWTTTDLPEADQADYPHNPLQHSWDYRPTKGVLMPSHHTHLDVRRDSQGRTTTTGRRRQPAIAQEEVCSHTPATNHSKNESFIRREADGLTLHVRRSLVRRIRADCVSLSRPPLRNPPRPLSRPTRVPPPQTANSSSST